MCPWLRSSPPRQDGLADVFLAGVQNLVLLVERLANVSKLAELVLEFRILALEVANDRHALLALFLLGATVASSLLL